MKLRKCYIENFGKLHNFSYEFSEGLNTINELNGWGKTTFATFIKVMFFGFDNSNKRAISENERKKYYPWQGGKFGGNLEFEIDGKIYEIERFFGVRDKEDTFKLYDKLTNCECNDFSENIGEEIFQIDRQAYERSTYIPQQSILIEINDSLTAKLSNILENENDINSSEEAINKIVAVMKEYKKTGNRGRINELENKIYNKKRELEYALKNEGLIIERNKRIEDIKLQIKKYEEEKNKNQEKINRIEQEEKDRLKKELDDLNERMRVQEKINKRQQENDKKRNLKMIISVFIFLLGIILGVIVSKYLYLISVLGVCICVIGLITHKKIKQKYDKQLEEKNNNDLVISEESSTENKEDILKENERLSNMIAGFINQKSYEENEMNRLINTAVTAEEIENDVENMEQELAEINKKYDILDKTQKYLKKAKEEFSSHYLKAMTDGFEKYVKIINGEKLDTNIDVNLNVKVQEYGEKKDIDYLSVGYKDLIGICMRFALIDALFENEKPFVILDDPFVNLDKEKIEKAKKIIEELSNTYQIIYFVCHESRE